MSTPNPFGLSSEEDIDLTLNQPTSLFVEEPVSMFDEYEAKEKIATEVVEVSRDTNPDQEVRKRETAQELSITPEMVEMDPEGSESRLRRQTNDSIFDKHEVTSNFMSKPENARIAHDSVEELGRIEGLGNSFVRSWLGIKQGAAQFEAEGDFQAVLDADRSFMDILHTHVDPETGAGVDSGFGGIYAMANSMYRYATSRMFPTEVDEYVASQKSVSDIVAERAQFPMSATTLDFMHSVEQSEGFLNTLGNIASNPAGISAFSTEVGIEFLPQLGLAGALTAVTKNPMVGAVFLGVLSGGTERYRKPEEFLRAAGVDTSDPQALEALLANPELMKQAQDFGFTRGAIIGAVDAMSGGIAGIALAKNPLASLLLQTAVQSTLGGTGEALAQIGTDRKITNVNEIIFEAIGELATTPIEVAWVGGRPLVSRLRDIQESAKADYTKTGISQMAKAMAESRLTERSPELAAEHVAEVFESNGVREFYIPADVLQLLEEEGLIESLDVADQMAGALQYGGDVRVTPEKFSQYVMQVPAILAKLEDHVRVDAGGITVAEAAEMDAEAEAELAAAQAEVEAEVQNADQKIVKAEAQNGTIPKVRPKVSRDTTSPVDTPVTIAEHEAGMQPVFSTAAEAGFTEAQYASYIESNQNAKANTRVRAEKQALKREAKRLTKEYKTAREVETRQVQKDVSRQPVYQVLHAISTSSAGRMDSASVRAALMDDVEAMKRLPKNGDGRRIYTPQGVDGIDPAVLADIHGFASEDEMLFALMDTPTFAQAVEAEVTRRVEQKHPTLLDMRGQIDEAMQALHETNDHGTILAFELTQIRKMRGQKRLSLSLIKARARAILDGYRVGTINTRQLEQAQRREARRAAKALRAGDLDKAAKHKLNQIIAFEMTKESYKIQKELAKGNKFMAGILNQRKKKRGKQKGMPIEFLEQAQAVLKNFQFGKQKPSSKRLQKALDEPDVAQLPGEAVKVWAARKKEEEGIIMHIGPTVTNTDGTTHHENLTLGEWRDLKNSVGEIVQAGRTYDKIRKANEALGIQQIVAEIAPGARENITAKNLRLNDDPNAPTSDVAPFDTTVDNVSDAKSRLDLNVAGLVLNVDSILRKMDGWVSLGPAYTYIKGGIDRAFTEGYMPGQIGYARRIKAESENLNKLFEMFPKEKQKRMHTEQKIQGVTRRLTKFQQIGVMLNMGNAENIRAMVKSKQFTEAELQAIRNNADETEMDFVQGVWDFWATFEAEIQSTTRRRQNRDPVMVEAQSFTHNGKTYRGGYMPLKYDMESGGRDNAGGLDFEEARALMERGGLTASHTKDGHLETRTGSGGRHVKLDPFIINQHLQQLVYDLEMGDAVHDSYKVLHSADMRKLFSDIGKPEVLRTLDLWLGDVITGELHRGGFVESAFRHLRTGTTISKLAWNLTTAALQPLGLIQSSVQIGRGNTLMGLMDLVGTPGRSPAAMYKWVTEQSGFMMSREASFNKDVHDAHKNLVNSWLARHTSAKAADMLASSYFIFITKAQRFVDIVTWLGAKRQGKQLFPGDEAKSTLHADRMVARTQGSGNFHERTATERGTANHAIRNTETIRVWSLFLSYFAAKMNVAYERTGKTHFKDPVEALNWAADMGMLFMVEGTLSALIKEGLDDDDDNNVRELAGMAAWEGVKGFAAGVPFAREAISAAEGFNTGGAVGGFMASFGQAAIQIGQGEIDAAGLKSINNVAGVLFKYPTSQVNKTGQAWWEDEPFDETAWWEYATGKRRKGN